MRHALSKGMLTAAAATSILSLNGSYALAASQADAVAAGSPGVLSGNNVQASLDVPVNACGNTVDVVALLNPAFGNGCANNPVPVHDAHAERPEAPRPAPHHAPPAQHHAAPHHAAPHDEQVREAPRHASAKKHAAKPAHAAPAPRADRAPEQHPAPRADHAPKHSAPKHRAPAPAQHRAPAPAPAQHRAPAPAPVQDRAGHHGGKAAHHSHDASSAARGEAVGSPGVLSGNLLQAPLDIPLNVCGNTVDVVGLLNPVFGNSCANTDTPQRPTPPKPPTHHEEVPPPPHHEPQTEPPRTPADDTKVAHFEFHEARKPVAPAVHRAVVPAPRAELAETGSGMSLLAAGGASAALLVGGSILYRRGAVAARR
ncbi:chaplin [Streptomyces tsukubensis]|uniref:Chaplin domain-containing protein n=1 Tax=Streptomyces tsukubensis TaxID=83656 RepID=A0A1V4A4U9_9ACTN|nr:chaplin [Streptomyces tsukubensis]OON75365.1 hypothetical protein B1H18_23045 [Streptomyces tsukubensis]QFR95006.1 DUF320 domain-containing protein [Streptomyces tsukubensis]